MNRVTAAIAQMRERVATLEPDKIARLEEVNAVSSFEHAQYQNQQARAHAMGRLTTAEAQVVYMALGEVGNSENGGWATDTDLATKLVVTKIIGELLGMVA